MALQRTWKCLLLAAAVVIVVVDVEEAEAWRRGDVEEEENGRR